MYSCIIVQFTQHVSAWNILRMFCWQAGGRVNPAPQAALCHPGRSLLDTLSLLHYCGSCSKQCNNERASVSWAQPHSPQPSPCPALPLSKAPQPDGSSRSSLLLTQLVIRMITSIKVTLSQEAVFVFYSEFGCDGDGMLGQKNGLL